MKRAFTLGTGAFLLIGMVIAAIFGVGATTDRGYAATYTVSSFVAPGGYYTAEEGVTCSVFIDEQTYNAYSLTIKYQQVKLNSFTDASGTENGAVTVRGGEVVNQNASGEPVYKEIARGSVAKSDLILNTAGNAKMYAYFDVTTTTNCAWAFSFHYQAYKDDEEHVEAGSKAYYFARIDDHAPTATLRSTVVTADGYRMTLRLSDKDTVSAVSSLKDVTLYKRTFGDGENDEVLDNKILSGETYDYVTTLTSGMVSYYLEVKDKAGNSSGKQLIARYSDQTYDGGAETAAINAMNEFMSVRYADSIVDGLVNAYNEYIAVTRDETKTEEEKQAVLATLKASIATYESAREYYVQYGNKATVTITEQDVLESLTVENTKNALAILPVGDEAEIILTPAKYAYSDKLNKKTELGEAGLTRADELYTVGVTVVSGTEATLKKELTSPLLLKMTPGTYKEIKAVEKVVGAKGDVTYYECLVVEYTDGTLTVEVPHTAGTVHIFVDRGKKDKPYWLFALIPIPLVPGVVILLIGLKKMKKAKQKALEAQEAEKAEAEEPKPTKPPKNKKKK